MIRSISFSLAVVLIVGSLVLVADGKRERTAASRPKKERVLYIGDSLSVGKFGEFLADYLVSEFGRENVALYASCGSSPENWIRDGISYETRCGYRELTVRRSFMRDPARHDTPRVEELLEEFQPTTLIIQLGTNWMDRLSLPGDKAAKKEAEILSYLQTFLHRVHGNSVRRIVWITPPDSAHYTTRVQGRVAEIIRDASKGQNGFEIIDSRPMTKYEMGKTGGDGVHYRKGAALDWANQVKKQLGLKGI
jgi:hypothetical protein